MSTRRAAAFLLFTLLLLLYSSREVVSTDSDLYRRVFATLVDEFVNELPVTNASEQCSSALRAKLASNSSTTRAKYLDALGKPGAGLGLGNLAWWGSYSECKTIPDARYCLASVVIKIRQKNSSAQQIPLNWGVCVPEACNADAVAGLLDGLFAAVDNKTKTLQFSLGSSPGASDRLDVNDDKPVKCAKASDYTTGVVATLVLCGVILFLCFVGTVWDIVSDCLQSQEKDNAKTGDAGGTQTPGIPDSGSSDTWNVRDTEILFPEPETENLVKRLFLCFSLIRNTSRIMDTKVPSGAITSINGMRVLSMFWVILGHTYFWSLFDGNISNVATLLTILHRFTFQGIVGGEFAVDTFFFLSGLLAMYLSIRGMVKRNGKLPLFQFYFHRFWRLTPTYMFILLFYDKLTGFLGEGPVWFTQQANPACDKYWWTNLLYINNFYPTDFKSGECMGWTWYLANDMQFYVISPLVLFPAYWFGVLGLVASAGTLLMGGFISTAVIIGYYNIDESFNFRPMGEADMDQLQKGQKYVYVKPYCRIAPYVVGLALGYLFHSKKIMSRRIPKPIALIGWCVAIALGLSTVYGQYGVLREGGAPFTKAESIMYGTFSRFAWGIAIAWVTYVCHQGTGGLVNKLLSASFWIPLSRLTYTAYLVHPIVLFVKFSSYETILAYSDVHMVFHFTGALVVTYMAAFVVSVCVEYPVMQLEKIIFKTNR